MTTAKTMLGNMAAASAAVTELPVRLETSALAAAVLSLVWAVPAKPVDTVGRLARALDITREDASLMVSALAVALTTSPN